MQRYLLFLVSLMLLGCNSGCGASSQPQSVEDLTIFISTPLKINQSSRLNTVCLNNSTNFLESEPIVVRISSENNSIATVNPSSCTLRKQAPDICCQFQITALATGAVTINASSPGHTAQGQILAVLPN